MERNRRKFFLMVAGALLFAVAGAATQSEARVSVNIGVNLPAVRFAAPPEVVVIPGTYVYMVPDNDVDVLFFQGYWWRPYEGNWYRSRDYNRGWRHVAPGRVPGGLRALPQDYRQRLAPGHDRIPQRDLQRNWRKWEKQKHWDRQDEQGRGGGEQRGPGEHRGQKDRY